MVISDEWHYNNANDDLNFYDYKNIKESAEYKSRLIIYQENIVV